MKKLTVVLSMCLFLGSLNCRAAQSASAATDGAQIPAIVTIIFSAVVLQTNEAQVEVNRLQSQFAARENHLRELNNEIEAQKKEVTAASDKLSDQERAKRVKAIEDKDKQLQRDTEDLRNDSQSESVRVYQSIAQKVYAFLQEFAEKHGYSYVLERGTPENPVVWFALKSNDITDAVVQAYNAKSGIAAPVPAAKGSPASSEKH
jgi:outer membrane protein